MYSRVAGLTDCSALQDEFDTTADRFDTTYRDSDVTQAWPSRDPEIVELIRHTAEAP